MRTPVTLGLAAVLVLAAAPVRAGEVADAAGKAEAAMATGNYPEALKAIDTARDKVWEAMPLSFSNYLFVAGDPQGYGVYDPRLNAVFKRSDPVIIYTEQVGYGYARDGELYKVDLSLDFAVKSADGKVLAENKGFGLLNFRSRIPNKEFYGKITYNFSGLQPGKYAVTTTAHDLTTGKTADFTLDFELTD
ncbi:MAG: hypothetical protein HY245_01770 [Rhizobiales bacterium]|nr:hypothetical protein [Hyphomicrobiales bacterium]MBI3672156.1 hypothetical protein [Hyphomicrobiales bacterium]